MDTYLVGVFSLAAVALVLSLTVAVTELAARGQAPPDQRLSSSPGVIPSDPDWIRMDVPTRVWAGARPRTPAPGRAPGAADGTHPLSEVPA